MDPSLVVFQYVENFINEELIDLIVLETNIYAKQCQEAAGFHFSKGKKAWKPAAKD